MYSRLAHIAHAERQDYAINVRHYSSTIINENARLGRSPVKVISVATYKHEADKVGGVARTNRVIAGAERLERVNKSIAYPIQRFSRRQRRG